MEIRVEDGWGWALELLASVLANSDRTAARIESSRSVGSVVFADDEEEPEEESCICTDWSPGSAAISREELESGRTRRGEETLEKMGAPKNMRKRSVGEGSPDGLLWQLGSYSSRCMPHAPTSNTVSDM